MVQLIFFFFLQKTIKAHHWLLIGHIIFGYLREGKIELISKLLRVIEWLLSFVFKLCLRTLYSTRSYIEIVWAWIILRIFINLNRISRVVVKTILLLLYLCLDLLVNHFDFGPLLPFIIQVVFLFELKFGVNKYIYGFIDDIELMSLEIIYWFVWRWFLKSIDWTHSKIWCFWLRNAGIFFYLYLLRLLIDHMIKRVWD